MAAAEFFTQCYCTLASMATNTTKMANIIGLTVYSNPPCDWASVYCKCECFAQTERRWANISLVYPISWAFLLFFTSKTISLWIICRHFSLISWSHNHSMKMHKNCQAFSISDDKSTQNIHRNELKTVLCDRKWCHSFSFSNSKKNKYTVNIADRFTNTKCHCDGVREIDEKKNGYVDIVLSRFGTCRFQAVWVRFHFRIHTSTIVNIWMKRNKKEEYIFSIRFEFFFISPYRK